jgi:predicted amidophosphoribosyltransferase
MKLAIAGAELEPSEVVYDGWIHAFGSYIPKRCVTEHQDSPWSQAVILAKRRCEGVCQIFGRLIARHLKCLLNGGGQWTVTHVPAEPNNQEWLCDGLDRCATEMLATCICHELSREINISHESILIQVRPKARKQHQCTDIVERVSNVQGLYGLAPGAQVNGRMMLLVDDVITSGATMHECSRVLKEVGGAAEVIGVALARTVRLRDEQLKLGFSL